MYKKLILPASIMAETIIGAGMFALPHVFTLSGIGLGLVYLLFLGGVLTLIHLMYADIILRTPENHRLMGYARFYFGKSGFWSSLIITVLGGLFILTAYLILSISFIDVLAPYLPDIYKMLIFWALASLPVFLGINKLAKSELFVLLGTISIVLILFGFSFSGLPKLVNIYPFFNADYLFFPFGIILFSMFGRSAIPAVLGYFRNNNESPASAKWPIILGTVAPIIIYVLFVFAILGLSDIVSEDAVLGLVGQLPFFVLAMLALLAIIELWSTYVVIARDVKKSLEHDLNFAPIISGTIIVGLPLILYFLGFQNFIKLVNYVGSIFISLEGILIILIWQKISKVEVEHKIFNRINPLLIYLLLLVFAGGILYKLVY
ncbi:MAG: aromatic amino acid transport family protein [Patescibacteria group bacterium]